MEIKKATQGDFAEIVKVYARAREYMKETGNPTQWKNTYPTEEIILADIEKEYLHILRDEEGIQGVFAFLPAGDPVYNRIDGAWLNDLPYAAIHRVASAGKRKGILAQCIEYCSKRSGNLKIDTHQDNKIMQNGLKKLGFLPCGTVILPNGESRIAFQRMKN